MMKSYVVFTNDEVQYTVVSTVDIAGTLPPGYLYAPSALSVDKLYVVNGELFEKQANPTTLEHQTLRNVPANSLIIVNDRGYENKDDDVVELAFDQPGRYRVTVQSFGYLDKEFTIEN